MRANHCHLVSCNQTSCRSHCPDFPKGYSMNSSHLQIHCVHAKAPPRSFLKHNNQLILSQYCTSVQEMPYPQKRPRCHANSCSITHMHTHDAISITEWEELATILVVKAESPVCTINSTSSQVVA